MTRFLLFRKSHKTNWSQIVRNSPFMKVLISTSAMQFLNVVMFPWKFTPQTRVGKQLKITHCFIWSTNYIVPLFAHERSFFQKYFVWMVKISTRVFPSTTTLLKSYLTMQIFSQQRLHFVNFSRQSCVINGIPRILFVIFLNLRGKSRR